MIEAQQDQPVFMLLALVIRPARVSPPQIVQLVQGLETHAQSDALPGDKQSRGELPVQTGLTPAGQQQRTPQRGGRTDVAPRQRIRRSWGPSWHRAGLCGTGLRLGGKLSGCQWNEEGKENEY